MRPTSTAALLAAATLIGATTINIPHTATVNRTAGCGTTTGSTVSPNTTPKRHPLARLLHPPPELIRRKQAVPTRTGLQLVEQPGGFLCGGRPSYTPTASAAPGQAPTTPKPPEDLQLVSDLFDEIRAGWCVENSRIFLRPGYEVRSANHPPSLSIGGGFVNTIACAHVGGNFAAFAAGSGSFLLHRQRRCLGAARRLPLTSFSHFADVLVNETLTWEPTNLVAVRARAHPAACAGGPRWRDTDVPYVGGAGEGGTEPAIIRWLSRGATHRVHGRQHDRDALQRGGAPYELGVCGRGRGVGERAPGRLGSGGRDGELATPQIGPPSNCVQDVILAYSCGSRDQDRKVARVKWSRNCLENQICTIAGMTHTGQAGL
ncbi:hypothetical protein B0H14DRAFT_2625961 [Mycena olivaceomarginata]|nr:hypothetical protein B0H14DRAFT_2625961 [Mycena olivaceomarginata]